MSADPRLEALVEKALDRFGREVGTHEWIHRVDEFLRLVLAEAMEAGAWVTCPTCRGTSEYEASCVNCNSLGRIRRELAGALWVAELIAASPRHAYAGREIINLARDKWGAKQEEKPCAT